MLGHICYGYFEWRNWCQCSWERFQILRKTLKILLKFHYDQLPNCAVCAIARLYIYIRIYIYMYVYTLAIVEYIVICRKKKRARGKERERPKALHTTRRRIIRLPFSMKLDPFG